MLFSAVASGEWAVMQGLDKLKRLANSTLYSSLTTTAAAIPLFYFFRTDGIVPVIFISVASNMVFARLLRVRTRRLPALPVRELWQQGRGILALGFYMTATSFVWSVTGYLFALFLQFAGSTSAVGIYQAGWTLINSYVGLIFTAISMEYYPRLTTIAESRRRTTVAVSHEISVALWFLMPVIAAFICCADLIVKILYTDEFHAVLPYISIGITGVVLRAVSWCMSYTILARGDGRLYVITESLGAFIGLVLNALAFKLYGFTGLGVAYVLWFVADTAIIGYFYRSRYGLAFSRSIYPLIASALALGALTLVLKLWLGPWITALLIFPWLLPLAASKLLKRKKRSRK